MKYYLSTNGDLEYSYNHPQEIGPSAPLAQKYGIGLELAEFSITSNLDEYKEENQQLIDRKLNYVNNVLFHGPFNELCPCAIDPCIREIAKKRFAQALELAGKYGAEKLVLHSGFVPALYYREWFIPASVDFWTRFLDEHPDGPDIVLENVMEDDPEMLLDVVKGVNDPRFRLCLDVGHANLSPVNPIEWLRVYGSSLSHLHVHNNNGPVRGGIAAKGDSHRAVFDGIIDMEALLNEALRMAPDATVTVETVYAEESLVWLKEKGFI